MGLLVCFSASQPSYAEAPEGNQKKGGYCDADSGGHSHNKKVLTDYSVIGIPGDGRCLFHSVAHGACIRAGKPAPNENLQKELADELRARVADEFIKRREETEWFIEGDFETYVSKIRRPHVWGGEPELLMASHVLQMPITVYMHDQESGGLISIAEYGQEYGKDNPVKVLYHGYGHYDALHIPGGRILPPVRFSYPARQPYQFQSSFTVLNNDAHKLKSWQFFVGFQHEEYLVSATNVVLANGSAMSGPVGNSSVLAGFSNLDLETGIETAGI
ncbi:OTU domain-containing protein [Striga hermonthica]|uniref:Ubiquitin thioesterase OTU n=1 Tax=Striga hermonthica TaxID=68872 RepID=A0A9N7P1E7_STRHE|nr:OTU domain-containing protein [Striga hermonthica]